MVNIIIMEYKFDYNIFNKKVEFDKTKYNFSND